MLQPHLDESGVDLDGMSEASMASTADIHSDYYYYIIIITAQESKQIIMHRCYACSYLT